MSARALLTVCTATIACEILVVGALMGWWA